MKSRIPGHVFLCVNAIDLKTMGTNPIFKTPLHLFVNKDAGDKLHTEHYLMGDNGDDIAIVVECSRRRAQDIEQALKSMAKTKKKILRTRILVNEPDRQPMRGW